MKKEKLKDVYVSSTGRYYHPEATIRAKTKMPIEEAEKLGYKPSKIYEKYIEKLDKEQKEK